MLPPYPPSRVGAGRTLVAAGACRALAVVAAPTCRASARVARRARVAGVSAIAGGTGVALGSALAAGTLGGATAVAALVGAPARLLGGAGGRGRLAGAVAAVLDALAAGLARAGIGGGGTERARGRALAVLRHGYCVLSGVRDRVHRAAPSMRASGDENPGDTDRGRFPVVPDCSGEDPRAGNALAIRPDRHTVMHAAQSRIVESRPSDDSGQTCEPH